MDGDKAHRAQTLLREALGDWWSDDRRRWCAYCGIPMRLRATKGAPSAPSKATRDHVIPRKHKGGLVTIPACRACNSAKGTLSLQEFLTTEHFTERRKHRHKHQWPADQLWLVAAFAGLKRAEALSEAKTVDLPATPLPAPTRPAVPPTISPPLRPEVRRPQVAPPPAATLFPSRQEARRPFGTRPPG